MLMRVRGSMSLPKRLNQVKRQKAQRHFTTQQHSDDGQNKKKRERKKTKNKYYTIFPFLLFSELQQVVDDEKRRKEKRFGPRTGSLVHRSQRIHFPSGPERNYIDRHTHKIKEEEKKIPTVVVFFFCES